MFSLYKYIVMNIVGAIKQSRDIQTEGSNSTENWPKQHHLLTGITRIILLVHNGSSIMDTRPIGGHRVSIMDTLIAPIMYS